MYCQAIKGGLDFTCIISCREEKIFDLIELLVEEVVL